MAMSLPDSPPESAGPSATRISSKRDDLAFCKVQNRFKSSVRELENSTSSLRGFLVVKACQKMD
jgi:hypothetical protein